LCYLLAILDWFPTRLTANIYFASYRTAAVGQGLRLQGLGR
jgi:hypothetical protein